MNEPVAGSGLPPLLMRQGPCFLYAVPEGFRVVEDGPFAVVLTDGAAMTVMVGNSGLPLHLGPDRYVFDQLARLGLETPRFGPVRPAEPLFGFPHAWEFDVAYGFQGVPCRGIAKCSVAPSYDCCTMVMTWAAALASSWPRYASWLPLLAARTRVTSPAAFGASGIAAQNLRNSTALGEQARAAREWSERQWADVTRARQESEDRRNFDFRQDLGGVRRYENPFDHRPIDLPAENAAYWVNLRTGRIVGNADPTFDPRTAGDTDWEPLRPGPPVSG